MIDHEVYTSEQAHNELYWCLCRRGKSVAFEGFFTENYTESFWNERVASWKDRDPDYREWARDISE